MVKPACFRSAFVTNHRAAHNNYVIFGDIFRGNTLEKACVVTNGCPESQLDSARVKTYLEENGWQIVDNVKDAKIILFNACGLTESSESNSIHSIHNIKKQIEDNQRLIVWGCLPKIDPETLFKTHQELSFGEREVDKLDKIIEAKKSINEVTVNEICQPVHKEVLGIALLKSTVCLLHLLIYCIKG